MTSNSIHSQNAGNWPSEGLSSNPLCPVCRGRHRTVLHEDLTDRVFNCAPGKWTMYHCLDCDTAYLDPCPTEATIHLAYQAYFTHQDNESELSSNKESTLQKFRVALTNGYRNWRFGTAYKPANPIGILAALLKPGIKNRIDAEMRYLPKPRKHGKLLDFGCGNGSFLQLARDAGWIVQGLDFDAKAVDVAIQKKLDVRVGGLDALADMNQEFDVITLSHIIEHVHDPRKLLELCYQRLKSAGCVWVETPNLNAYGHEMFGENWRDLDPPRHLTLFSFESLILLLQATGFTKIKVIKAKLPAELVETIFSSSEKIKAGEKILDDVMGTKVAHKVQVRPKLENPANHYSSREFITLFAFK